MSSPGLPPLELDVAARRAEQVVAWSAIGAATFVPWFVLGGWLALLSGVLAALASGAGFHRAGWLRSGHRIGRVSWPEQGHWLLTDHAGRQFMAHLRSDTRVTARFVWLRWDALPGAPGNEQGACSMLLTPGDIPHPQLRRLRVRLRLAALQPGRSGNL